MASQSSQADQQQQQQQQSSQSQQPNAWEKAERKFANKNASEYYDPCQDFADRSLKCMKRNAFDKEMCGDYFQAYRDCKKQWLTQKKFS
uniref:Cytochrome c oxidase-assembly factor cox23, mitochondrial n=1 Tax=Aspergillus clavatus (strain ATCC 1007 / CBS 513.65 / DSM 816 / NCTC 3887 / NRRL 1 / QM 1276 / 107) TaxID=344612 RepID=COX23_ASPCL|nr:RecName: Full=Cytochrome c oxidase-assembly factor cox23, mitochondrial; Flags: Precursor [Aspergillus clavatus NRRL 1]